MRCRGAMSFPVLSDIFVTRIFTSRILQQLDSISKTLIIYPRQSKKIFSRCSIVGINGKVDPLSEYDEVDEEVIYLQESPNMVEVYK